MKIAICDDEIVVAQFVEKLCVAWADKHSVDISVKAYTNSNEFLPKALSENYEIILLDIDMPTLSGFDIATKLAEDFKESLIIFVTGQETLVYESFKYKPFDFVRKSKLSEDLELSLNRALAEVGFRSKSIVFKSGSTQVCLKTDDIIYLEAQGNDIVVYCKNSSYTGRNTIKAMQSELADRFVRTHKGFLVNMKYIDLFGNENITLKDKTILPMGRAYSEEAKKKILKFFR